MEPQIRYVRSADGTKIATATAGDGPHLVMIPPTPFSSIEGEWAMPLERAVMELLAASHTVVRFDPRGQGLSDRDVADLSLEARVADIEAVFESLPAAPAFVFSRGWQAPATITFVSRHPERVRRLVLSGAGARGRDYFMNEKRRAVGALFDVDWELYCNAFAFVDFGWTEEGRQYGLMISKSTTPDIVQRNWRAMRQFDASELLPSIRRPTLVMYPPDSDSEVFVRSDAVRSLAAAIPGARLQPVEGPYTLLGSAPKAVEAVLRFFAEDTPEAAADLPALSGTSVILFADIADSTALTERLGDAAFREKARELDEALRNAIASNGGQAIDGKLLGDGVLATFGAAREAIACAAEMHRLATGAGGGLDPRPLTHDPLLLHVGIHAGDVIRESNNVYGGAVNIAARISGEAAAGETLVSATVRELARTSAGVSFEDRGERELKGVGEPVRVYAVRAG
jgi:class 3 adenylate cyclase